MVTSSSSRELIARLRACVESERATVLLVLRSPAFGHERAAARAFADAAERVMRGGDMLAHDARSDWFALAMLAPARSGAPGPLLDARATLERIAAAMSLVTNERIETGWWPVEHLADVEDFDRTIERALERGARERERFEFLAAVGHELRTPLTSIRGYVETLLDEPVDPETSRRFLGIVRNEALRLGRLVEGMLEFSLLDLSAGARGGIADLGSIVRSAVEVLAPVAARAGIALEASVDSEHVAHIDPDACMHALLNLIENAIKYGGRRAVVSLERQDAFVCIAVDDDGPGVDPVDRTRIFSHRVRGTRSAQRRGSGLGLSIARAIAERVGGTVNVTDSALGGARFIVALPSFQAELAARTS